MERSRGFLQFNVRVLSFLNLWLRDGEDDAKKWKQIKTYYLIISTLPTSIPLLLECCVIFGEDDVELAFKIQALLACVCVYGMFYVAICFLRNRKAIKELVDEIRAFKVYSDLDIYEVDRRATLYSKVFLTYSMLGILTYAAMPLFSLQYCKDHKYRSMEEYGVPCGMVVRIRMMFRIDNFPLSHVFILHQVYVSSTTTIIIVNLTMLLCGILLHVISQLKQLRNFIMEIPHFSQKEAADAIRFAVRYHVAIIELARNKGTGIWAVVADSMGDVQQKRRQFLGFSVKVLTLMNLWLRDGEVDQRKWTQLRTYFIIIISLPTSMPLVVEIFFVFREDDVDLAIKMQSIVGTACVHGMFYMVICFLRNRKAIKELVNEIESFQQYSNMDINEVDAQAATYAKIFLVYSVIGISIFATFPVISTGYCEEHKYQSMEDYGVPCSLMVKFRMPFRIDVFPWIEIYFALQIVSSTTTTVVIVSLSMLLCGLLLHIISQLKQLRIYMLSLSGASSTDRALHLAVKYHIAIVEFTNKVNEAFGSQLILYVTLTSFVISILGFVILIVDNFTESLRFGMHLAGWFVLLFLICHYGQLLIDESVGVARAAYFTEWYNSPVQVQKDIRMIIMRSQKPLTLKALNLGVLSASTFLHVLSSAYSYFTLLLNLKK